MDGGARSAEVNVSQPAPDRHGRHALVSTLCVLWEDTQVMECD